MNPFAGFEKVVRQGEPLAMHTWLQLGGPAEYFAEPRTLEELVALVERSQQENIPIRFLGDGSNVLVREEGVPGLVVRLSEPAFCEIRFEGTEVTVGAGAPLRRVVTSSVREGLAGLEALVAIPGTVGGALASNVTTHGMDITQPLVELTVIAPNGSVCQRSREELLLGYRRSKLGELAILAAKFSLEPDNPRELARRMQKLWIIRKASQPMGHQCAARVFQDPRGMTAGQLIEQAGLKGTRIGGAVVSERHANYIVAEPECTPSDVLRLIDLIRAQVSQRFGVQLELALEIW